MSFPKTLIFLAFSCSLLLSQPEIVSDRGFMPEVTINQIIKTKSSYVIVGPSGLVASSVNGINWAPAIFADLIDFRYPQLTSIAWNGSVYLATGDFGQASTSVDGINWDFGLTPGRKDIEKVIWNGSHFIAVGQLISVSNDGKSWTETDPSANLNDVACKDETCYAVGENGAFFTSTDLQTWTSQPPFTTSHIMTITAWNSILLAVTTSGQIFRSSDGENWTLATMLAANPMAISANSERVVVLMEDGLMVSSSNADVWEQGETGLPNGVRSLIWDGERFIGVGEDGLLVYGHTLDIWTYILREQEIVFHGGAKKQELFISPTTNGLYASSCARSWRSIPAPIPGQINGVDKLGSGYIGVGDDGFVATSNDGYTWTPIPFPNNEELFSVVVSPGAIVVDGAIETYVRPIDVNNWQMLDLSFPPYSIIWDGNIYVGIGPLNSTHLSTDGFNWESSLGGSSRPTFLVGGVGYYVTYTLPTFGPSISFGIGSNGVGISNSAVPDGTTGWRWLENDFLAVGFQAFRINIHSNRTELDYRWNFKLGRPIVSGKKAYIPFKNTNMSYVLDRNGCECPIFKEPEHTVACIGEKAQLSVHATNAISFQWRKDGVPIPGATQKVLTIEAFSNADVGSYDCVVETPCITVTSAKANLEVGPGVAITTDFPAGSKFQELTANFSCDPGNVNWYWRDVTNKLAFGKNQSSVLLGPPLGGRDIEIVVSSDSFNGTARNLVKLFVPNDRWVDPNGDGCRDASDIAFVAPLWLTHDSTRQDPNGDGRFDIRDFLYIPTDQSNCTD